ncbi:hypothetical protein LCGC14_3057080 [marine sediment metagenome]|uniref:Uncharacterized protein n=1 Tax=marine sediment metagenome TaxID=412755 RepID=A0A0F8YST3_9ZZZZ
MALYKIVKKEIEATERTYEVKADREDEALSHFATLNWGKVHPRQIQTTKYTELVITNIL